MVDTMAVDDEDGLQPQEEAMAKLYTTKPATDMLEVIINHACASADEKENNLAATTGDCKAKLIDLIDEANEKVRDNNKIKHTESALWEHEENLFKKPAAMTLSSNNVASRKTNSYTSAPATHIQQQQQQQHKLSTAKALMQAIQQEQVAYYTCAPVENDCRTTVGDNNKAAATMGIIAATTFTAAPTVADTCSGITALMDSRVVNGAVVNVDVHNNVDDSANNNNKHSNNDNNGDNKSSSITASHALSSGKNVENNNSNRNNNSNKLVVDNAKSLDNNNRPHIATKAKATTPASHIHTSTLELVESSVESTLASKVPDEATATKTTWKMTSTNMTTAPAMAVATTITAATTTIASDNHKINNYEIHQPPPPPLLLHGHMLRLSSSPPPPSSIPSALAANTSATSFGLTSAISAQAVDEHEHVDVISGDVEAGLGTARELASPRCQSRESTASGAIADGRCPSNDSHCSGGNESTTPAPTPIPTSSPIGLPLPATLAPAAAAALLPPQSAAMAAYLNAAAAAAQQNHLLLTNPLAAAASLVQQATQQSPRLTSSAVSPSADAPILDFSTKRRREFDNGSEDDDEEEEADEAKHNIDNASGDNAGIDDANSPLDLSVSASRKRHASDEEPMLHMRKSARSNDYKALPPGTWVPPINPYLAAVAAASLSPKTPVSLDWNGKQQKISPNEATKALEKMTEMTRLGSATESEMPMRQLTATANATSASNGRHSAWQSHWLNKGADSVKDVFKCVWCKQSFPTLATLTTHMKETQHCGVNVPPTVAAAAASIPTSSSGANQATQSSHHSRHSTTQSVANNHSSSSATNTTASSSGKSDLNLLIKETMPLPRKLVRGQDVWLGKGAEQTRQILKCMWCGQSFRSLAEMTSHMQETQHYTNIISQEQIISWKSSDDKSSSGGSTNGATTSPAVTSPSAAAAASAAPTANACASNATVSAVLTCKVCDQAFSSLKELSNHMVKNSHYKEHMMRTAGESSPSAPKRGRQTREKRKKSLPVRKLLELERAQQDFKQNSLDPALKPLRDFTATTKITCEKCGDKVETAVFVDHIRQCLDSSIHMSPRSNLRTSYGSSSERLTSPQTPHSHSDGRKTADDNFSPISRPDIFCPIPPKDGEKTSSTPSVLNAIEQLIEKSFDTRSRLNNAYGVGNQGNTPLGSSILKRLGIDDSVDYTKPLMDPQTMHFLRTYSGYSARDRSASESSSVSERCSSRIESVTPERNSELSRQATPRLTPEKLPLMSDTFILPKEHAEAIKIKSEPMEQSEMEADEVSVEIPHRKISVKKEFSMANDNDDKPLNAEASTKLELLTPKMRAISPSASERSSTPKSTSSLNDKKIPPAGSSLNALSSMFDNLNNMNTNNSTLPSAAMALGEPNNNNSSGKKSNANPLAALQKLCETTDPPAPNTRSNAGMHTNSMGATVGATTNGGAGNMVAFSWACNDAVMTADSIIKCSFCDTPFCSKGAYRHHLSKVHFVKEDNNDSQSSNAMKSPGLTTSPKSVASPKSSSKSPAAHRQSNSPATVTATTTALITPTINPYNESPQSKFLKYTELAKQLSSKNV